MRSLARLALGLTALTLASAPVSGQDLSGRWVLSVELDAGSGDAVFVLEQDGTEISGSYTGVLGEQQVTGSLDGDTFEWSFSSEAGRVQFSGTIDGDAVRGTCTYGQLGEGTFVGERDDGGAR